MVYDETEQQTPTSVLGRHSLDTTGTACTAAYHGAPSDCASWKAQCPINLNQYRNI